MKIKPNEAAGMIELPIVAVFWCIIMMLQKQITPRSGMCKDF